MDWAEAAGYGAVGGVLVELLVANGRLLAWQADRHRARSEKRRRMPRLRTYIDPPSDIAAVAAGASAPAMLRQIGSFTSVQGLIRGEEAAGAGPPAAEEAVESGGAADREVRP
ncbi:hypothetical protein ACGF13_26210 [Kitasatospora sp. NPDC048286]|uniref:hypothetical protein n=1 Tax=Kitasatospora sp. NPDC048286 TaxID=3364047 RepID=UPI00371811BF